MTETYSNISNVWFCKLISSGNLKISSKIFNITIQPDFIFVSLFLIKLIIQQIINSCIPLSWHFLDISKNGLKNCAWKWYSLLSSFSKNFIVSCLKESIEVLEFSILFEIPISTKNSLKIFQIFVRLNFGLINKFISATSTIFCKKNILVWELFWNSLLAISHIELTNSIKVFESKDNVLENIFSKSFWVISLDIFFILSFSNSKICSYDIILFLVFWRKFFIFKSKISSLSSLGILFNKE